MAITELMGLDEAGLELEGRTAAQVRTLINVEVGATADQTGAEIKTAYEGESDTNAYTDAEKTKVGHISVTQAVDLDAVETRVNELDAAVVLQGTWDASAGSFPTSTDAGQAWIVSVDGTVDSVDFAVDDRIIAITDSASTSVYASNWLKLDYTDKVSSVAGRTGAVTLGSADVTVTNNDRILGRVSGAGGAAEELTATQVRTLINVETGAEANDTESIAFYCGAVDTDATTGTKKAWVTLPYGIDLSAAYLDIDTAPTGSSFVADINADGTSILSTKLSIDAGETSSRTAATPYVFATGSPDPTILAAGTIVSVDIDQVGSSNAGQEPIVTIEGTRI